MRVKIYYQLEAVQLVFMTGDDTEVKAKQDIMASVKMFKDAPEKPHFKLR